MGDAMEFEGDDLAQALARAGESLGKPPEELSYEVMQEGRRGFLGVGSRGVRIRVLAGAAPSGPNGIPARPVETAGTAGGDDTDTGRIREFLRSFSASSPFEIEFRVSESPEQIRIDLDGRDRDLFLSRRGEGLNALQVVLGRIASQVDSTREVFLDCGDFRKGREEELTEIAHLTAEKVKKMGEPQSLSPMNPYDRRLVHLALKDDPAVETRSDGEGFLKSVTIYPRQR
jgi:spoIIIJ-associated protein